MKNRYFSKKYGLIVYYSSKGDRMKDSYGRDREAVRASSSHRYAERSKIKV